MASIIDGKAVAREVQKKIKEEVDGLERRWGMAPGLAVVLVGDDPGSHIYVKNKDRTKMLPSPFRVIANLTCAKREQDSRNVR